MKHLAHLAAATLLFTQHSNGALIISEVVDATLPGGLPKFVELTNTGTDTVDLSLFSIGSFNNGAANLNAASTPLSGSLAPGDSYVISHENDDGPGVGIFYDTYGFDPDNFDLGSSFNGNDVIALFQGPATGNGSDATLYDIYGEIGVDGTGEVWEYTDGYSVRIPSQTQPAASFDPSQWLIAGAKSLKTGDDPEELALILAYTSPGTHNFLAAIPEPVSATSLGALLFLGLAYRNRRR